MRKISFATQLCLLLAMVVAFTACGDDEGGGTAKRVIVVGKTSPGSGLFVVDCTHNRAYVPLLQSPDPATGNGRIAVIDLSADPDSKDPRIATIVLTHKDNPTGTALDPKHNLVIAVSGESGAGGFVDIIDTTTNPPSLVSGSPFAIPTGSEPGGFGQVLYDPEHNVAIISVNANASCPGGSTCTGFITFDPSAHTFGSVIGANYPETFAFNASTNQVINSSDDNLAGQSQIVDIGKSLACNLSDNNIGGDQDGASVDSTTNITVISNEDGTATVLNLNGSKLDSSVNPCVVNEGGTPPNSALVDGLPSSTAGSAVNPKTHEAFLIEDGSPGITLLQLPSKPVKQIDISMVKATTSAIPNDPQSSTWATQGDPYAVAYDVCHNIGYAVDESSTWLVGVDIPTFKSNAGSISTALPAGNCAGTNTTFSCKNGNGVIFYPLPPVPAPAG